MFSVDGETKTENVEVKTEVKADGEKEGRKPRKPPLLPGLLTCHVAKMLSLRE